MADTLGEIVAWAEKLPAWQSDAVRRLLVQDDFTDADENELFLMLKEANGLVDPDSRAPEPQIVRTGEVSGAPNSKVKVTLKAVQDIRNVNALPPNATLPIRHEGLTVIYGKNASGKSGYVRVFKRACKARDTKERIYPNVFEKSPFKSATATFNLSINDGTDQTVAWQDGKDSNEVLTNISVFDSKCARLIVDKDNQVTYLPYGAYVFEALGALLIRFQERLRKEKPQLQPLEYDDIPATTKAGQFLAQLSTKSDLRKVMDWNDSDEKRLKQHKRLLTIAEELNSQKHTQRLRNTRKRILLLLEALRKIDSALSARKMEGLKKMLKELLAAKEAFKIASQEFNDLKSKLLPGFGETAWQILYEAAKEYSVQSAYTGKEFPHVGEDSRCVLCQQPLSEDAKKRMQQFKTFMEQSAKTHLETVREELKKAWEEIDGLNFGVLQQYNDVLDELREDHAGTIRDMESFFPAMENRAKDLKEACVQNDWGGITPIPANPADNLVKIAEDLESEAQKNEELGDPEKLSNLKAYLAELEARKRLIDRMPQIRKYVAQMVKSTKYDACMHQVDSRPVTLKGKAIISESLSPQLISALGEELDDLGARIPLNLRTFGEKGETRYQLELRDSQISSATLGEVLSEGEHCVVAIAGFLAELKVGQHDCPVVFDDPVSSLDHRYREKIAQRLVKESFMRQVIVFTHDIAFLLELQTKAGEFGAEAFGQEHFGGLTALSVRRCDSVAGVINEDIPWEAKKVGSCLNELKKDLADFKDNYTTDMSRYNRQAGELYARLRDVWENSIEQVLFNGTVRRFVNEVQTLKLRNVSIVPNDAVTIYLAMKNCSRRMTGHSKAKSQDHDLPSPEEIGKDIDQLIDFIREMKKRHRIAEDEYNQRLKPQSTKSS